MIDYVVYSTSNSDYQSWQCKLLEYSFKKVNQQGKLIRLCSYNTHCPDREFDTSDIAEIIKLPDYRTRWTEYTDNLDKDYGIVNKTESLKYWLLNYPGLKDTDTVLLVDPDMVFIKPIDLSINQGTIIGQRWIDVGAADGTPFRTYASPIKNRITEDTIFMYPYVITVGDLRKIINKYVDLTYQMRLDNYPDLWEAEMYALIIAALSEKDIEVRTVDNLGFCLTWSNQKDFIDKQFVDSVYVLHYPWSILDKNEKTIFNKQDYTPLTKQKHWHRVNPNLAISFLERKFLSILDSYNLEKIIKFYWEDINLIDSLSNYQPKNKYLVFRPWPGGFNNIRMSLEIAACIAFLQNRILVLPPEYHMYLLQNINSMSTFFDINDLGIKTISFEKFGNLFNIKHWEDAEKISYTIKEDILNTVFTDTEVPEGVLKGREITDLNKLNENEIVFFDGNLLGSFYLNLHTNNLPKLCKYVARHIHYNKEIFYEAYKAIHYLKNYYAIHIRRNDFQYKDLFISAEEIYNNIKDIIPEGSKLYISTDENDKVFFSPLKQHYNVFFYNDIKHFIFEDINVDLIGSIEQIICTEAITFIGSRLSTFSSYIYRLRGYMKHITDKRFLTYHVKCEPNKEEEYWWSNVWAREYSDVWEQINNINYFSPQNIFTDFTTSKKIFVSVASYRDNQLTDTINSLFANQSGDNEIIVGVCMQDTEENYNSFKYKNHPNVKIHFIPYQEAKGVCHARRLIQQEIFQDEDYFLQVDSHSRVCPNWDKTLIRQINRCPVDKVILSTYPNSFDVMDDKQDYFNHDSCPYLKIGQIEGHKIRPVSAGIVPKGEMMLGFWVAAGFIFTKGQWCREVEYSSEFYFAGEEDHLSVISYIKGWDVYIPDVSTVWHDYTDNRLQSSKKYRPLHWEDHPGAEHNLHLLVDLYEKAYGIEGKRTSEQFLKWAKKLSHYDDRIVIEFEFDYTKIPESDPNKKIKVIVFAFRDNNGKEVYRPDIYNDDIFNRVTNKILFNIYNYVHENATKIVWFYKYEDDTFSDYVELPIIKHDKTYKI